MHSIPSGFRVLATARPIDFASLRAGITTEMSGDTNAIVTVSQTKRLDYSKLWRRGWCAFSGIMHRHDPGKGHLCCGDLGIRTVLIGAGLTVLDHENKENNHPDQRNKTNQQSPSTVVGVVQPAKGHGQARNYHRQDE